MKTLIALTGIFFSACVCAANIPQDTLGAEKYDKLQCIDNTTQDCINSQCMNSDQIDCQDNCRKMAQAKCQQQLNE